MKKIKQVLKSNDIVIIEPTGKYPECDFMEKEKDKLGIVIEVYKNDALVESSTQTNPFLTYKLYWHIDSLIKIGEL